MVDRFGIDEKVCLKIIFETTKIEVDGAGCHEIIIYYHCLGMKHTGSEKVYLDPCLQAVVDIGAASITEEHRIGVLMYHHTHIAA